MEAKRKEIPNHATGIGRIFASVCDIDLNFPLLRIDSVSNAIVVTVGGVQPNSSIPHRTVTTDLGRIESVLGLPIPEPSRPRFWVGLHELWETSGRYKLRFKDCGLRIYVGEFNEESRQFLRLEWVAPEIEKDGTLVYQGKHAGHPHWHVDRAALVGPVEHLRSLERLTRPVQEGESPEIFDSNAMSTEDLVPDLSWFGGVHLPAQSQWMHEKWDGSALPAPHQTEPDGLQMLSTWWEGSLRYIFAELSQHASL